MAGVSLLGKKTFIWPVLDSAASPTKRRNSAIG